MKLTIKEYLASLKERSELDVILPDLLSQCEFNVLSSPGRGSTQYGVDVAAVGSLNNQPLSIYLFSIKAGDITRQSWNGGTNALRQSIEQILDVYIQNHLSTEHRTIPIKICICFGGEVKEQVRLEISSYYEGKKKQYPNVDFEEWNGDKLAELADFSSFSLCKAFAYRYSI